MDQLTIPETNVVLYPGTIVILAEYPYSKWIVKHGWYNYRDQQLNGWYFRSITDGTTLSLSNVNLSTITVVSQGDRPHHPHPPVPPVPGPGPGPRPPMPPVGPGGIPGGVPGGMNSRQLDQLRRSFIVVDTIKQRDALDDGNLPDGKICRVNNVNGRVRYYAYDISTSSWIEQPIDFLNSTQADQDYVRKDEFDWEYMDGRGSGSGGSCSCPPSCGCRN